MKFVVTGAAGFVGAALCERLVADGHDVVGTDLRQTHAVAALDVTDKRAVAALVGRLSPDVLIHAAALVDDRGAVADFRRVNVGGTRNILQACADHNVGRLVHVSSIAAVGLDPGPTVDDTTPLALTTGSPYFDTKALSEWLVRRAHAAGAVPSVIVRPGDVWGPGSDPWVRRPLELMERGMPVLIGGGAGRVAHCWIDTLIDGLVAAATHRDAPGRCFTFHDDQDTTLETYMTALAQAAGFTRPPRSIPSAVAKVVAQGFRLARHLPQVQAPFTPKALVYLNRRTRYSVQSSREVLGWSPTVDLTAGMTLLGEHLANT